MDYFSVNGSCLFSILIPLNFAIGDVIRWLKERGITTRYFNILAIVLGCIASVFLINKKVDPYIPFILMGGILVAEIQNSIIQKKTMKREDPCSNVEILFFYVKAGIGIGLLVLPYTGIFWRQILLDTDKSVPVICYVVYFLWGIEMIALNIYDVIRYKNALHRY